MLAVPTLGTVGTFTASNNCFPRILSMATTTRLCGCDSSDGVLGVAYDGVLAHSVLRPTSPIGRLERVRVLTITSVSTTIRHILRVMMPDGVSSACRVAGAELRCLGVFKTIVPPERIFNGSGVSSGLVGFRLFFLRRTVRDSLTSSSFFTHVVAMKHGIFKPYLVQDALLVVTSTGSAKDVFGNGSVCKGSCGV